MRPFERFWPLFVPAAYLLHLTEEMWAPPGFAAWAAAHLSSGFTVDRFLLINAVAWPGMVVAGLAAVLMPPARALAVSCAAVLVLNGVLHLASTVVTRSYSPGLVSGVLVYIPLGLLCLRNGAREMPRGRFAAGVVMGLAAHALVAYVAFGRAT